MPGPGGPAVPPAPAQTGRAPVTSVVVVGAGLAGARTVLELRAQGFTGHVTVIGAEHVAPYDRPPLSKHLLDRPAPAWLADELGTDALALADDVRLGTRAVALRVDPDGVRVAVTGADGPGEVAAHAVVVATGAAALRPPAWSAALTLHTADDAERLRAALRGAHPAASADGSPDDLTGRRLVVIGAGWVGAEVATVAAAAGADVTVVEARDVPLGTVLGTVGALTTPWYAAAGVRLRTGVPVERVEADAVTLADGTVLPADVVLAAVGARPATSWLTAPWPDGGGEGSATDAAGAGLDLGADGAVRVDEQHAPVDGPAGAWRVRVVGDAALRRSARHDWVPGGHWDAALRGPATAVAGLLGREAADPDPAPYVFSTQLGHELALHGLPGADDEVLHRGDPAGADGWSVLWFAPGTDRLTAVFSVDRPRDVGGARRLLGGAALPVLDRTRATDPAVPLARTVAG